MRNSIRFLSLIIDATMIVQIIVLASYFLDRHSTFTPAPLIFLIIPVAMYINRYAALFAEFIAVIIGQFGVMYSGAKLPSTQVSLCSDVIGKHAPECDFDHWMQTRRSLCIVRNCFIRPIDIIMRMIFVQVACFILIWVLKYELRRTRNDY